MKTERINSVARFTAMAVAIVLFAGVAGQVQAQTGAKGGATKLLEPSGSSIKPATVASDYQPMSCAKCKNEVTTRIDRSARGANKPTVLVAKHLCSGCRTDWDVVGHGKAKRNVAIHECSTCGDKALACCSTRKGGNVTTKGMEKKFELAPLK